MTMIMLDYMCVQSFMTTHMTNNNLYALTLITSVHYLRLFVVVYKLVKVIFRFVMTWLTNVSSYITRQSIITQLYTKTLKNKFSGLRLFFVVYKLVIPVL